MPYTILGDIGELQLVSQYASWRSTTTEPANPCVILTLTNDVIICGNIVIRAGYSANTVFAVLPESMRPAQTLRVPIYDSANNACFLLVSPNGNITLNRSESSIAVIFTSGITFNVSSRYYNPEIGNIYNNGTSPLSEE